MSLLRKVFRGFALLAIAQAVSGIGSPAQVPLAAPVNPFNEHGVSGLGTSTNAAITPETSAFAEKLLREKNLPGLSVGVVRLDEGNVITEFGAWGKMTEDDEATNPRTLFSIGSCSKAFLTAAVGILMDDFAHERNVTALPSTASEFTWDTKVQALLPDDWLLEDEWATEKVNVRDLLNHVTGMTRHDLTWQQKDSPLDLVRKLRFLKTKYELREHRSYNNLMYVLGSHLITKFSGTPFPQFVKERIFEPLNMTYSTFRWDEAEDSGLLSHGWSGPSGRRIPYLFAGNDTSTFIAGAGGIISNAIDMSKWAAMLINRGVDPHTNRTVIPYAAFVEVTTPHSIVPNLFFVPNSTIQGYGLGWLRTSFYGHDIVLHTGGLPGFLSHVIFLPSNNIGVVAFSNADGPHQGHVWVPFRILEDLLGLEHGVHTSQTSAPDAAASFSEIPVPGVHASAACESTDFNAVPLESFAGIYSDPGYGVFEFCAPTSGSASCKHILSDFASLTPDGTLDPDTLYGYSEKILFTHFVMKRACAHSFVISAGTVFPKGFGKDTTPFMYLNAPGEGGLMINAECVVDEASSSVIGCGIMNVEEGAPRGGDTIQERADVWLVKQSTN